MEGSPTFVSTSNNEKVIQSSLRGQTCWQSPSNIALVKYWGKYPVQIPANPSVSFTLNEARTVTKLEWDRIEKDPEEGQVLFSFRFDGKEKPEFRPKLETFFRRILPRLPLLTKYHLKINSQNTFPHSSGIASSASAMSALAAALTDMEYQILGKSHSDPKERKIFLNRASEISRLGSGSACRSFYPDAAIWGRCSYPGSSDEFAVGISDALHPVFHKYHDDILLIDQSSKSVTSSGGHQLMEQHPFSESRFLSAHQRTEKLLKVLKTGDLREFIKITESEALTLHALMMASDPGFILLHPNTLRGIQRIRQFREDTGIPVCFTLDAGPNIHLLYPDDDHKPVEQFVSERLLSLCENNRVIRDRMGKGAEKMDT